MTDTVAPATTPLTLPALSERMAEELARLDIELGEIDLLIAQAKTEAERHETRRDRCGREAGVGDRGGDRRGHDTGTRPRPRTSTPSSCW